MKLQRGGWTWHLEDPSVLDPWADHIPDLIRNPVKRNGIRSIFKAEDSSGRIYFVKAEEKNDWLSRFRNRFFSKAESEYRSAQLLRDCGIPCAQYTAWGRNDRGGAIVVSRSLEGSVSAMELWYAEARFDENLKQKWLDLFFDFALRFREHHLTHPDFHSANVMLEPHTYLAAMIDTYGIHRELCFGESDLRAILAWLPPLRMDVPVPELAARLEQTGLLKQNAETFLRDQIRRSELRLEAEWEKRRKAQILSGNSKFSHTVGNREYRHTLWYEPAPMPEEQELLQEEYLPEDAQKIWLDSFRDQLFCRKLEKVPLILEKNPGKYRIFSLLSKKNSYFC